MATAEFFPPVEKVRSKAVNNFRGLDFKLNRAFLAEIEQMIDEKAEGFIADIADRLGELREAHEQFHLYGLPQRDFFAEVMSQSTEIKRIGGTIGYPLLTFVAKGLGDFVRDPRNLDEAAVTVVNLHIDT
jgi:hypothetical protein